MKTKSLIVIAASIGLIGAANAEEGKDRPERKLPPELMEKIDTNKDGKISPEEREAAQKHREGMMEQRRKEMLEKYDTDGDGQLSDTEKEAMHADMKKRMLEKYDKDGDGKLSEEERAEARKEMGGRPGGADRPRPPVRPTPGGKGDDRRKRPQGGGDAEAPGAGE